MSSETPQDRPQASQSPASSNPSDEPAFGWTAYAELINGRFAMIGLVGLLLLEAITHQDFFTWLNIR
jgi:Chlorophyll A-B binding protein